jgi:AsmA protein
MRFIRVVFIFVIVSVVGAVASVTYITQVLDPNDLKPTLVNSAKKQQVRLELQGNITWAFWPWFGISVEKVRASSTNWDFEAERLEGSLSILSLLSDTIVIDRLNAITPKVTVRVTQKDKRSTALNVAESSKEKTLLVRQLAITDGEIDGLYPELTLSRVQLSVDSLTPETASDLSLSAYLTLGEYQAPLQIQTEIIPTAAFDGITIRQTSVNSRDLNLKYDGYLSGSNSGQFSGEGKLSVSEFSFRQWLRASNLPVPVTSDLERFSKVSVKMGIKVSNEMASLRPFTLVLDETSIDGRVDLGLQPLNIDLELLVDQLNIDQYLVSSKNTESDINHQPSIPFPLGTYKIDIGTITVSEKLMTDVGFDLGVGTDEITLGRLDAKLFGGELRAAGTYLIAPQISNITGTVDGVQLSQLQFSKPLDTLSGSLQSSFDIRAAGRTPNEMLASISGPLRIKIQNALLGPLNVSDALCQAVSGNTEVIADSADTMTVAGEFQEGIAVIDSLKARVANLAIQGRGRISLVSTASNIRGSIRIPAEGVSGSCTMPEILHGVSLPLSCRGQLRNETLKCSIDEKALQTLITEATAKQLEAKTQDKLQEAEARLKSTVEETLDKKIDGQGPEFLNDLLNR